MRYRSGTISAIRIEVMDLGSWRADGRRDGLEGLREGCLSMKCQVILRRIVCVKPACYWNIAGCRYQSLSLIEVQRHSRDWNQFMIRTLGSHLSVEYSRLQIPSHPSMKHSRLQTPLPFLNPSILALTQQYPIPYKPPKPPLTTPSQLPLRAHNALNPPPLPQKSPSDIPQSPTSSQHQSNHSRTINTSTHTTLQSSTSPPNQSIQLEAYTTHLNPIPATSPNQPIPTFYGTNPLGTSIHSPICAQPPAFPSPGLTGAKTRPIRRSSRCKESLNPLIR